MEETMTAACDKINSVLDKLDLLGVDGAPAIDIMDRTKRLEQVWLLTLFNWMLFWTWHEQEGKQQQIMLVIRPDMEQLSKTLGTIATLGQSGNNSQQQAMMQKLVDDQLKQME